jgi:hypothetical protein
MDIETHNWELYHVDEDYAECHNLAAEHRGKLIEMIGRWWAEAGKFNVLPIDGERLQRMNVERPTIAMPRGASLSSIPAGRRCRLPLALRPTTGRGALRLKW